MTKVLSKAFGIIEAVALASPNPVSLSELSARLKINKATCSRLAGELVDCGYLEQKSRLSGFSSGPRAWALGQRALYEEELRAAAEEPLRLCGESCGQSAMLAILRNGYRYILSHKNYSKSLRIELRKLVYVDTFYTATGVVLLSHASAGDYAKAKDCAPESSESIFKELGGEAKFLKLLEKVRKEGHFVRHADFLPLSAVAFPVFKEGECVAAVGVSASHGAFEDKTQREFIVGAASKAAKAISESITQISSL